jgi:hypothetical protein
MSNIWREVAGGGWQATALAEDGPLLLDGGLLCRFGRGSEGGVALLVRRGLRALVNGQAVLGGLRVVVHKDEVLLGQSRFFFSAEAVPVVARFRLEAGSRAPTCPTCRGPLRDGEEAVQCPGCRRWYHQIAAQANEKGKTCWTYAPTCRFCTHPTSLGGEPVWRPEQEEGHA